jgi:site-specific recombinase XerD
MTHYDDIFETWIREKEILDRCSPRTIDSYRDGWNAFKRYGGSVDKVGVKTFVLNAVNAKLTPRTINSYASGINSFLTWLHTNERVSVRLRVPLQPTQKRVLPTYTTDDAAKVLNHKPQTKTERRLSAILHLIADAGLRIDECLSLPRSAVDFVTGRRHSPV